MTPITHSSNQPADYSAALDASKTLGQLRKTLTAWRQLAHDAEQDCPENDDEFLDFRVGLRAERAGNFAGEKWAARYGAILMPEVMFKVNMVANRFSVPWGLAYIRLRDHGAIATVDGIDRMQGPPAVAA